ncbi:S-layer homology domain-containing protein [Egicoccus sp. AB-alg2]|uniref:S-layer homology domain-containing protein n=1 Tax=Egicoccus sp. AB-alg2 TaxID=3242693 RepID=UPI00359CF44A
MTTFAVAVAVAALAALTVGAPALASPSVGDGAVHDPGPGVADADVTHTYTVETRGGVQTDPSGFAADAESILGDARGWTLGGSIAFEEVASGGDFTLVLASPSAVDAAHEVCSPDYSCRVGDQVLINDRNWQDATPAWRQSGAPLYLYRQYLVNHEVGHYLGFGHYECQGAGERARVMQQQSISLDGCEPSGWPDAFERQTLADWAGVAVHDWVFPDVLHGDAHRDAIHAAATADVVRGHADGYFRPTAAIERGQMASMLARALDLSAMDAPPFADVADDEEHREAIAAVAEAGISEGYEDGTYRPRASVTRAQMAAFLARAFGLEATSSSDFPDVPADHAHADAIAAVAEADVAEGFEDGTFRPHDAVTRAQLASFLDRAGAW